MLPSSTADDVQDASISYSEIAKKDDTIIGTTQVCYEMISQGNTFRLNVIERRFPFANFLHSTGLGEYVFVIQILSFLPAKELCRLSLVSRYFSRLAEDQYSWKYLLVNDFEDEDIDENIPEFLPKSLYVQRYKDLQYRILIAKELYHQQDIQRRREFRSYILQRFIDFTQVRILGPLPFLSSFLTLLLLGLKFNNTNISIWACFAPIFILLAYIGFCLILTYTIYSHQSQSNSLFSGMWSNLRSPLRYLYVDVLHGSSLAAGASLTALLLVAVQVVLLALKLAAEDGGGISLASLSWAVVFVPIWMLFLLSCAGPATGCCRSGPGPYVLFMVLLWVPFFILFCCLAIKLDARQKSSSRGGGRGGGGGEGDLPLVLVFVPFWAIEGFFMSFSLLFMLSNIYRYFRGVLDRRLDESVGMFVTCWLALSPFVIFQALLCVRDANKGQQQHHPHAVTSAGAVTPLLLLLGWCAVVSCLLAARYRTAFQEVSVHRTQDSWQVSSWMEV